MYTSFHWCYSLGTRLGHGQSAHPLPAFNGSSGEPAAKKSTPELMIVLLVTGPPVFTECSKSDSLHRLKRDFQLSS